MYLRHKTLTGAEFITIEDALLQTALGEYKGRITAEGEGPSLATKPSPNLLKIYEERDRYRMALEKIEIFIYARDLHNEEIETVSHYPELYKIAQEALDA